MQKTFSFEITKDIPDVFFIGNIKFQYHDEKEVMNIDDCKEKFKKELYSEETKMTNIECNSGYVALCSNTSKKMSIYQHGRMTMKNLELHNEEGILHCLEDGTFKDGTVLISSYYSPCKECRKKIMNYLINHTKINIQVYFFVDFESKEKYEEEIRTKLNSRFEIISLNWRKNSFLVKYMDKKRKE